MYASPFIDETFDIYNCHNYTLSIQCALDGFSFSIFDLTINKFIVFSEYDLNTATPFELKNELTGILNNEPILQQVYKHVKVSFITVQNTLVPSSLFQPEEIDSIFELSFQRTRNDEVIANTNGSDLVLLAAIPKVIMDLFRKQFPNCMFYAPTSSLFRHASQQHHSQNQLLVNKIKHTLFLLFKNKQDVKFVNSFFVKNETDCVYYILNTVKQLQGDAKTEITLMGNIELKSELETVLKRYFEKVNFARFSHQYAVSYTFYQEPEHYHLATTELALCE